MRYPTDNNRITSYFGWRKISNRLDFHNGLDYGCWDRMNPTNDPIYSISDGKVMLTKYNKGGYGNYVVIEHDGYCSLYAHLKEWTVKAGDIIKEGDVIGKMGTTGNSTGIHLHFEIREVDYATFWTRWRDKVPSSGSSEPVYTVDPEKVFLENMNPEHNFDELVKSNVTLVNTLNSIYK